MYYVDRVARVQSQYAENEPYLSYEKPNITVVVRTETDIIK